MNSARAALLMGCLLVFAAHPAWAQEKAPPKVLDIAAAEHVNKDATVVGRVTAVTKSRSGATYLNFGDRFPRQIFSAIVPTRDEAKVGDVKGWEGKAVAVTGRITLSPEGKPQIVVRDPGQIAAADLSTMPAAPASPAPAPSADAKGGPPAPAMPAPKPQAPGSTPAPPPSAATKPVPASAAMPPASTPAPSAAPRKIALAQGWDGAPQGGAMTRKDLATVFAGLGKTDGEGNAPILLYADIPYLAPLAEAKKRLKLEGAASNRSKVTTAGLPIGSFSIHSFSGVFEGGYNRLCLITDLAEQVVGVQLVEDAPRQRSKEVTDVYGFHTYNFVSGRTKGTDDLIIKHEVVEGPPQVVVVESLLVNPNPFAGDGAPGAKSSKGSSGKSRKPTSGEVMEMSRWFVPVPVVRLILRCAEGR